MLKSLLFVMNGYSWQLQMRLFSHNVLLQKNWIVWITDGHISRYMVEREMILVSNESWKSGPNKTNNSIYVKHACSWFCRSGSHGLSRSYWYGEDYAWYWNPEICPNMYEKEKHYFANVYAGFFNIAVARKWSITSTTSMLVAGLAFCFHSVDNI